MTVTEATEARTEALPEIVDPARVAPKDARQLSRLFFDQLAVLEEGTPEY
ncbi:RNA polymerase sigma factor SigF, partial [Streptomyces avermitilis]